MSYALLVGKNVDLKFQVFHMAIYENQPSQIDKDLLRKELENDNEFGLTGEINSLAIKAVRLIEDRFEPLEDLSSSN